MYLVSDRRIYLSGCVCKVLYVCFKKYAWQILHNCVTIYIYICIQMHAMTNLTSIMTKICLFRAGFQNKRVLAELNNLYISKSAATLK